MTLFFTISGTATRIARRSGVDVVSTVVNVFDEHGLRAARPGGDSTAELDANALDVGSVAGLEAHPELVGAIVDE